MTNVKELNKLRASTGLGLLECKKTLEECAGSFEEAENTLRKRYKVSLSRLNAREAKEGRIGSYIHIGAKVGVLIEVNCETDFAAETEVFKKLCMDLCLQIAATNPSYLNKEEIPKEDIDKEVEILSAGLTKHTELAKESIIKGKLQKYFSVICLLEQQFVRDYEKSIQELINETSIKIGEKITIKRFIRYQLGN